MALPDDQKVRLRCFANALANWNYEGYVIFKKRVAEWLLDELSLPSVEIARLLHEFVANGGRVNEIRETRAEYVSFEFHYDLRVRIGGRLIYFEMVLECDEPDDPDSPRIEVVNAHDA